MKLAFRCSINGSRHTNIDLGARQEVLVVGCHYSRDSLIASQKPLLSTLELIATGYERRTLLSCVTMGPSAAASSVAIAKGGRGNELVGRSDRSTNSACTKRHDIALHSTDSVSLGLMGRAMSRHEPLELAWTGKRTLS
jgi:hypothetical protein